MKHPLTKTLTDRWLQADGLARSAGGVAEHAARSGQVLPVAAPKARHAEADALADHAIGVIAGPDGDYLIAQAGPGLGAVFGRKLPGTPFGWLFREMDRREVLGVLRAAEQEGLACILSADMPLAAGAFLSFEAMLMPRGPLTSLSGMLAPFTVPAEGEILSPFLHLRSSRFVQQRPAPASHARTFLRDGTARLPARASLRWKVHHHAGRG